MSESLYWPIKMVLAIVGVIGLLVVPGFVWVTGIGLDSGSLTGVLVFFGFMLAISLAVPFAFLLPAMEGSRAWRIGVALVLLAYVVPVSVPSVWPLGNLPVVVEFGAAPAAVGLFLLA